MLAPFDPLAAFRLDGKTVLVTGASSGLGARFARVAAAVGARVVLVARRADRLAELQAELPGSVALPCDVADAAQTRALARDALARCRSIDVLVNNAGASDGGIPAEDLALEEWQRVVAINQTAPFHLAKLLAPSMIERKSGCIVNVASIHGLCAGAPNDQAAYVASKAALIGLTRELAVQWAEHGIRVNAIAPAYFETELTTSMFASERSLAWIQRNTPMRRPGRIDELDGALLYLASDASSYVTGTTLIVDGGWTAR
jgi:NAD(P)-dependent dehydrogenase (short-subunit alcohol dehydrogenase family)